MRCIFSAAHCRGLIIPTLIFIYTILVWLQKDTNMRNVMLRLVQAYRELMQELSAVSSGGRKFSRDEMNERR